MRDNKREQERTELYRTIWALANELRGSVDGWDFKQYVLGMLFYRYISENLTTYLNKGEWDAGNTDFDYAKISDEEALSVKDDMVQEKGFFILPSELFGDLLNRIKTVSYTHLQFHIHLRYFLLVGQLTETKYLAPEYSRSKRSFLRCPEP